MGLEIQGANGSPVYSDANRLHVVADSRDVAAYAAANGLAFVATFTATPTAGANVFAYLANTSSKPLVITELLLACAAAENVQILKGGVGAPSGGSAPSLPYGIAPFNVNSIGTVATLLEAAAITGTDSAGALVGLVSIPAANGSGRFAPESRIWLPPSSALWLKSTTGGAAVIGVINFFVEA